MALGFGNSILPILVQQGFVADLQKSGFLFAIPVRLFEGLPDGFSSGFVLGAAGQRLQSSTGFVTPASGICVSSATAILSGLPFSCAQVLVPTEQGAFQK